MKPIVLGCYGQFSYKIERNIPFFLIIKTDESKFLLTLRKGLLDTSGNPDILHG